MTSANQKAKMQCPLYTNGLPGREWNIPLFTFSDDGSDDALIREIEDDVIAFFRYFEENDNLNLSSWLFVYSGGMIPLGKKDRAERDLFVKKMEESKSWILRVTCTFLGCVAQTAFRPILSIVHEVNNEPDDGDEVISIATRMHVKHIPPAANEREDNFLSLLIRCAPMRRMSVDGLQDFRLR